MKNKTKYTILLFLFFILTSCVSTETKRELIGSDFVSNNPSFKIHFKKKMIDFKEQELNYSFFFSGGDFVKVIIHKPDLHNVDYFYSLEFYLKSLGDIIYIDSVYFNDHEWAKYVHIGASYLCTGYFTRKNYDFIEIFTCTEIDDNANSDFEDYKKTLNLKDSSKIMIDKRFEKFENLLEIIY